MIAWVRRTLWFAWFSLQEYARSGRIVVELAATVVAVWLFFYPRDLGGLAPQQFFSLGGLFIFALTAYTTVALMNLGNRPQGFVLVARPLGRKGYLFGLYAAVLAIATAMYLLLSVLAIGLNTLQGQPVYFTLIVWLAGSLPLLLDVALIAAFVTLVSSLVLSSMPRLALLALLTLAVSTDLLGPTASPLADLLRPVQALLGLPLLPALSGFALAVQQTYNQNAIAILLGQVAVTLVLLALSTYAFSRRDLVLPA
jgi:hypothetical protein